MCETSTSMIVSWVSPCIKNSNLNWSGFKFKESLKWGAELKYWVEIKKHIPSIYPHYTHATHFNIESASEWLYI